MERPPDVWNHRICSRQKSSQLTYKALGCSLWPWRASGWRTVVAPRSTKSGVIGAEIDGRQLFCKPRLSERWGGASIYA
eukprot:2423792-Rhodomonas_salina.1